MTLSDDFTLGISILALVFSVITFAYNTYQQYLKAAELGLVLGSELTFGFLDGQRKLGFWVPVALTNQGAVDAIVLKIEGTLTGAGDRPLEVEWSTVGDYDGANNRIVPKGGSNMFVVSSRKATTTWIGLRTTTEVPQTVDEGTYALNLKVYAPVGARRRARRVGRNPAARWSGDLALKRTTTMTTEAPENVAGGFDFKLLDSQVAHLVGTTPQSATALMPGLRDLIGQDDLV